MITLKPYSPDLFVHRSEVDLINGFYRQLLESGGKVRSPKAILFRGERGFGKTWLSLHFHRTVLKEFSNVESLYLALFPLVSEYQEDLKQDEWCIPEAPQPEVTTNELMQWICKQLGIKYPHEPSMTEIRRALVGGVENKFQQYKYLVLILDSVFEANWDLLEAVEQNLLAPLAEIPNIFFLMTGRGRPYPWISPALRVGMREETLKDFPIEQLTKEHKQAKEFSGGSPLVAYALLQFDDPVQALDEVADYLLEVVPPSLERRYVRQAFEALCVLDEFREGEMETMLKAYYQAKKEEMPPKSIRDVRDDLLKTYLFRWEGGGFRVDDSLRNVLRHYLMERQSLLWKELNRAAYEIYIGFAEKYKQYEKEYKELAAPYSTAALRA